MTQDTCEKQPLSGTLDGVATPEIVDVAEPLVEDTLEGGEDTNEGADENTTAETDTTKGGDTEEVTEVSEDTIAAADETDTVTGAEDEDAITKTPAEY